MATLLQDIRYGCRMLVKAPAFTAVAVLMLALGIGANTAIFTVVNAVLLRPLPYGDADRLVQLYETWGDGGDGPASPANFRDWQQQNKVFEQLAAYTWSTHNLQQVANPERVPSIAMTANMLATLRVGPALGRDFTEADARYGAPRTVILGDGLWRRRFNADAGILGKTITLDGEPTTVIGIMPPWFHFEPDSTKVEMWEPLQLSPKVENGRGNHFLPVIGRLKPGISLAAASENMKAIARGIAEQNKGSEQASRSVLLMPLRDRVTFGVRTGLMALLGAVGLVLLIACANIANLLLARAAARRREVAVRVALGASRRRLIRQFLTESLLLAGAGGALGLLLAKWGVDALSAMGGAQIPRLHEISFDPRVFLFLLGISVATGTVFGLAPALQVLRPDVTGGLKQAGANTGSRAQNYLRRTLVVTEIALSLVLLIGAGLLLKTLVHLRGAPTGMSVENVTTFHVSVAGKNGAGAEMRFYRPLLEKLQTLPGVRAAGMISLLPIQRCWWNSVFEIEGQPPAQPGHERWVEVRYISPGYFAALGIPIVRGRDFDERDRDPQALTSETAKINHPVVLINEAFAQRYFPNADPVGKHVKRGGYDWEIVGVAGSVRQAGLDYKPLPEVYFFYEQAGVADDMAVVVAANLPPTALVSSLRNAVHEVDRNQPIFDVETMDEVISQSVADRRLYLVVLGAFAIIALAVACAGIYGVISYVAARRTQEFGLRIALGAGPADVVGLMLREGALLVGAGTCAGIAGALAATRVIRQYLFGVQPTDMLTFAVVSLALAGVAMLASYIPAHRASKVDPMVALRYE